MGTDIELERARTLILNEGDRVKYHGVDWYYLRGMKGSAKRAAELLEDAGQLERWSEKSRDVVRFVE